MADTRRMKRVMEKVKAEHKAILEKAKEYENSIPLIKHEQVVVTFKSENNSLKDRLENIEAQLTNRKKDIEALEHEKDNLQLQVRELQSDVRERDNKLHALRKNHAFELQQKDEKIAELEKTIKESDVKDLRKRLQKKSEEISELNQKLVEKDRQLKGLESDLGYWKRQALKDEKPAEASASPSAA